MSFESAPCFEYFNTINKSTDEETVSFVLNEGKLVSKHILTNTGVDIIPNDPIRIGEFY